MVTKMLSSTLSTTRRSEPAPRKWFGIFWMQAVVKHGETNGGVIQTTPAVTEESAEEGKKDNREWKDERM
jgi:hypothetical protein